MNKSVAIMGAVASIGCVAVLGVAAFNENALIGQIAYADPVHTVVNCGNYSTTLEYNISHEDVLYTIPEKDNYANFNGTTASALSDIVTSMTAVKGQFYRQETGKTGYSSWKFGTGSVAGSLEIVLDRKINAIGFYAVAYANSNDVGKYLKINGVKLNKGLVAAEGFDIESDDQRFFIEFDGAGVDTITIAANEAKNNRFYLYSIGFYTSN